MPRFSYIAITNDGKEKKGNIEADNEKAADAILKQQGLRPMRVQPMKGSTPAKAAGDKKGLSFSFGSPRIKGKDLTVFTRQLATLIQAGLPLVRALRTLEKQARKKPLIQVVIKDISDSVESGMTFQEALNSHPKTFTKLYVNMVKAGEASGSLEEVLSRLADFMEKSAKIQGKIKSASTYPAVVMAIAVLITTGLMIFIVPKFEEIFTGMLKGEPLPDLTKFVVGISRFMTSHYIILGGMFIITIVGFKVLKRTEKGQRYIDYLLLNMPPFSSLVIKSSVSRFARTLGTLQKAGVSIIQALKIVRDTSTNSIVADAIQVITEQVTEGEPIARPMEQTGVFPDMVVSMVEVGEETGELSEMLERVADTYDDEVDNAVDAMTSLIEPILIVCLAVVVGFIVIAMFMPMITLIKSISN